jgi:GT2 family glycosyltransferase
VFIGVPILNRLDLLERCLAAIDYPAEIVIVNNNTVDGEFKARLEAMATSQGFRVLHQTRNLGVSGSWNLIARTGFAEGHEWVFIGSNDTFLRPGSLRAAVEFPKEPHVALYHLEYYNFFMVSQRTIDDVGWFDENFYPAYCEDKDFSYRCTLANLRRINIIGASGEHVGSATIHSNPHYFAQNERTHQVLNNEYYVRKWGARDDEEVFTQPFNDPDHDHRWWPDPGDSIAERDWDRIRVGT